MKPEPLEKTALRIYWAMENGRTDEAVAHLKSAQGDAVNAIQCASARLDHTQPPDTDASAALKSVRAALLDYADRWNSNSHYRDSTTVAICLREVANAINTTLKP